MKYELEISLHVVVDVPDGTDKYKMHELYDEHISAVVRSSKSCVEIEDYYMDEMYAREVRDSEKEDNKQ